MLYGSQLFAFSNLRPLEIVQIQVLRTILAAPPYTPSIVLCYEADLVSINAQAKALIINYWLKLVFSMEGLAPLTLQDSFQTEWKHILSKELVQIGFSPNILIAMGHANAKVAVKQRIWYTGLQRM